MGKVNWNEAIPISELISEKSRSKKKIMCDFKVFFAYIQNNIDLYMQFNSIIDKHQLCYQLTAKSGIYNPWLAAESTVKAFYRSKMGLRYSMLFS